MRPLSLLARMGGVDVYKTLKYLEENPEEIQPQYRNGGILKAGEEDVVQRLSGFYKLVEQAKEEGGLFPRNVIISDWKTCGPAGELLFVIPQSNLLSGWNRCG